MKLQNLLAAILCAATALAHATEGTPPLEILIVTGTRMPQPLKQTLSDSSVITEQDIQASQAADVSTLLRSLAGVEIVQSGGPGKQSSIFMRGTESDHVLVLLDGVRINSATTGTTALEHIMLDGIARIEVVRGNVSSLYGSEAIGGVIQIFTKRGSGTPALNASAGLGSHGTRRVAAGFSGNVDATSYSVTVGKVKTAGISAINTQIAPTANPDKDGYDNLSLNAQVQHAFNADHQLSASLFHTRGDSSYDKSGIGLPTDQHNSLARIGKVSIAANDQLTDVWHSKLQLASGVDDERDYKDELQQNRLRTTNTQAMWQNELSIADNQKLTLAAEHLGQSVLVEDIATPNPYTQTKRGINSLLAGYVGEYGKQQVQLNLRQDRYSDFGTANTGLLGYGLSFSDSWRAMASVSNAFKAPSFNDLYRPSWGGNPDLKPERANNREIGLRYASEVQQVDVIYFDNRLHDLIAGFPSQNIDRARIDGWEFGYTGNFGDTQVKANITLQNPRDTATNQILLRRAKSYGNLGVIQNAGALQVGGEILYSGTRDDYDINTFTRTALGSYYIVNLTSSYAISKQLKLSMRADNLLNEDFMLAHGYNTLGRTLFAALNYQQ